MTEDVMKSLKRNAVNKHYHCCTEKFVCPSYSYCKFGTGENTAWDACECDADAFASGYEFGLNDANELIVDKNK